MKLFKMLMGAVAAAGLAGAAQAQTVGIATSNPGSIFHNIGSAVAKVANESGLNATIQPATSPNQYLPLVNANEIEFGVGNVPEFNVALQGIEWFSGAGPQENLRLVGLIFPLRVAIFVRQDSDIKTIADLEGQPMVDGFTAQQTILPQLDALYATAGMTRDDVQPVQVTSVVSGADAFMAGDAVGFYFAHGAGKVREADAAVGGIRALPVENNEENVAAMREHWPNAFLTEVQPGPAAPGVAEPAHFMAYPQAVFTNADVPDDVVYQMAKAIYENKEGMAAVFPPFNIFKPDEMVRPAADIAPAEYHPGAIEFYKEAGIWKE
jgi:TRAP transporter TAXI family solute receptor